MNGITWLASYPKSGNTWMRIFLTNYWRDADTPADINALDETPIASSRPMFDEVLGVDSTDLTRAEIDRLRPAVYKAHAFDPDDPRVEGQFCKIHDAYLILPDGQPMFPAEVTAGAIYILRNPFDVAVSYANHSAKPIPWAVRALNDPTHTLAESRLGAASQLHQPLSTWSGHVESWMSAQGFPIHLARYEDMIVDPVESFRAVVRFIGGDADSDAGRARIDKAIRFSEFGELKKQEEEKGFREKMIKATSFFNQGKSGTWRDKLTPDQIETLRAAHAPAMLRYGYLDGEGNITC